MRVLSTPRPDYVQRCGSCGSAFYYFGAGDVPSHNDLYQGEAEYRDYLEAANEPSLRIRHEAALVRLKEMLQGIPSPKLFDVGAGAGDFLDQARDFGFVVAGNEVSQPAVNVCRERHGIDLALGDDLEALAAVSGDHDVLTMWCVIAHVDDPRQLLRGIRAMLRPGGILFLTTPRYCFIDRIALMMRRVSGDRYRRMFDRRINAAHRRQYSRRGMEIILRSEGFTPVDVSPAIGYGLHMTAYLHSMGVPNFVIEPIGKCLEFFARAGLAPRNILNVYARAN